MNQDTVARSPLSRKTYPEINFHFDISSKYLIKNYGLDGVHDTLTTFLPNLFCKDPILGVQRSNLHFLVPLSPELNKTSDTEVSRTTKVISSVILQDTVEGTRILLG